MFDIEIKFTATNKEMIDIWPHPKPSNHFTPKEYKKLDNQGGK